MNPHALPRIAAAVAVSTGLGLASAVLAPMATAAPQATMEFRPATVVEPPSSLPCKLVAGHPGPEDTFRACSPDRRSQLDVAGSMVTDTPTRVDAVDQGGSWTVRATLTPGAGEMVLRYTSENPGKLMAVVHDGVVLRAQPITAPEGGQIVIGAANYSAAHELADELRGS